MSWIERYDNNSSIRRPVLNTAGRRSSAGYAVLRWDTPAGGIGLAHSQLDGNAAPVSVLRALKDHHGTFFAGRYACVVVAQAAVQASDPGASQLLAADVLDGGVSQDYETTWRQPATVLEQPAPSWAPTLRDRDAITAWRPGSRPWKCPRATQRTRSARW